MYDQIIWLGNSLGHELRVVLEANSPFPRVGEFPNLEFLFLATMITVLAVRHRPNETCNRRMGRPFVPRPRTKSTGRLRPAVGQQT